MLFAVEKTFQGEVVLTGMEFSDAYKDNTSQEYQNTARDLIAKVNIGVDTSHYS